MLLGQQSVQGELAILCCQGYSLEYLMTVFMAFTKDHEILGWKVMLTYPGLEKDRNVGSEVTHVEDC